MKKRLILILIALLSFTTDNLFPDPVEPIHDHTFICGYDRNISPDNIYVKNASTEAEEAIFNIIDAIGLYTKFEVKASNIPTAAATIINNKRYILYNEKFMSALASAAENDWTSVSILAHEIAHHLNGHTMDKFGMQHQQELEADEFSGYVLRKLGASVTDAQQALAIIAENVDTKTHPARDKRLKAIAKGWQKADQQLQGKYVARAMPENIKEQRSEVLAEKYIVSRVVITGAPSENYYITTGSNFVKESSKGLEVLGKVQKNRSTRFPFAIINENEEYILINDKGRLVTKEGKVIGYLKS